MPPARQVGLIQQADLAVDHPGTGEVWLYAQQSLGEHVAALGPPVAEDAAEEQVVRFAVVRAQQGRAAENAPR